VSLSSSPGTAKKGGKNPTVSHNPWLGPLLLNVVCGWWTDTINVAQEHVINGKYQLSIQIYSVRVLFLFCFDLLCFLRQALAM
jgi:hypothetical protein